MLNRIRISSRLQLGFGVVVLVLFALATSLYVLLQGIHQRIEYLDQVSQAKTEAARQLTTGVNRLRLVAGDLLQITDAATIDQQKKLLSEADAGVRNAISSVEELRKRFPAGADEERPFSLLKARYAEALATVGQVADMQRDEGTRSSATMMMKADVEPSLRVVQQALDTYLSFEAERGKQQTKAIGGAADRALQLLVVISLAALLVSILVAWAVTRSIVRPMGVLVDTVSRIAQGDLTVAQKVSGSDEVSAVQAAVGRLGEALTGIIGEIQRGAGRLTEAARSLSDTSAHVRAGSEAQSSASAAMAAALEQIGVSVSQVANSASDARQAAVASGGKAEEGAVAIRQVADQVLSIVAIVRQAADETVALGEHFSGIATIVDVIRDLADQTNLLALNAAIEAARAGEHGRGFAVVADEVRKLAEKTSRSAADITQRVDTIHAASAGMAAKMVATVDTVQRGMADAQHASEVVEQARSVSGAVVTLIDDVDRALREQAAATNDIARRVEQIVQMIDENSLAASSVAKDAGELTALGDALVDNVSRFRLRTEDFSS